MKAVHRIRIKDPVKAKNNPRANDKWIKHSVKNCNQFGQEVPLSSAEQTRYNQTRQNFEDADFHLHKNGRVRIVFKIKDQPKGSTQWEFRDIPLTISRMPRGASLWRSSNNHKKAVVILNGRGNQVWEELKYTLHYQDVAGVAPNFDHDPVIRTGNIRPSSNFLRIVIEFFRSVFYAFSRAIQSGFGFR